jgi:23S rRNA (pseudouridine1915-N3)-methyltransferase
LKLILAALGRLRSRELAALRAEYVKRMGRYAAVKTLEIKEEKGEESVARQKEAARVKATLRPDDYLVLCDERGTEFSSRELAGFLAERERSGRGRTLFLIGGPFGVHESVRGEAQRVMALSRLTLPHELAQVILAEALYRAMTIIKGGKYHHE